MHLKWWCRFGYSIFRPLVPHAPTRRLWWASLRRIRIISTSDTDLDSYSRYFLHVLLPGSPAVSRRRLSVIVCCSGIDHSFWSQARWNLWDVVSRNDRGLRSAMIYLVQQFLTAIFWRRLSLRKGDKMKTVWTDGYGEARTARQFWWYYHLRATNSMLG